MANTFRQRLQFRHSDRSVAGRHLGIAVAVGLHALLLAMHSVESLLDGAVERPDNAVGRSAAFHNLDRSLRHLG